MLSLLLPTNLWSHDHTTLYDLCCASYWIWNVHLRHGFSSLDRSNYHKPCTNGNNCCSCSIHPIMQNAIWKNTCLWVVVCFRNMDLEYPLVVLAVQRNRRYESPSMVLWRLKGSHWWYISLRSMHGGKKKFSLWSRSCYVRSRHMGLLGIVSMAERA